MSIVQHVIFYEHQFPNVKNGKGFPKSKVLFPTYTTFLTLTILMKMLKHILTFLISPEKVSNGPSKGLDPNQFLKDGHSSTHPTPYHTSLDRIVITKVAFVCFFFFFLT